MPAPNMQKRLEQVKKKMGLTGQNPFDVKNKSSLKREVIMGQQKQNEKQQKSKTQLPAKRFEHIQDERPDLRTTQLAQRYVQTADLRERVAEQPKNDFSNNNQEIQNQQRTVQEIYMEIQQKSKQAKAERQNLRAELEARIRELDVKYSAAVAAAIPRGFNATGSLKEQFYEAMPEQSGGLCYAGRDGNTLEERMRAGQEKLMKLDKKQKNKNDEHLHQELIKANKNKNEEMSEQVSDEAENIQDTQYQNVATGGDDEALQYIEEPDIMAMGEEEEEESETTEEYVNAEQIGITEQQDMQFSEYLQKIPYYLPIQSTFEEFNEILENVNKNEQLIVYDRLIKTNSTFVNKNNLENMQVFIQYTFKRMQFLLTEGEVIDYTSVDQLMRCLKHQTIELPHYVAGMFNAQFQHYISIFNKFYNNKGYYPSVSQQFVLLLRIYQICYFQGSFVKNFSMHNQSYYNFIITLQTVIYQSSIQKDSTKDLVRYLELICIMINSSIQLGEFSSGIIYGLNRLNTIIGDITPIDGMLDFDAHKNKNIVATKGSIKSEIQRLIKLVYYYFKLNYEIIPTGLAKLIFSKQNAVRLEESGTIELSNNQQYLLEIFQDEQTLQRYFNNKCDFLKERQFHIREQDPNVMKNFNPKRNNNINLDKQRETIQKKFLKRKEKDDFRRNVKQLQYQNLAKQNEELKRRLELQKLKNKRLAEFRSEQKRKHSAKK